MFGVSQRERTAVFVSYNAKKTYINMAQDIILTKESSESEIKAYFKAILRLSQDDNEFPINLDEVWMLVYGRKSDATEALQRDFIENVDYQVLRQNPQNPNGGRPTNDYLLSISCLEFFIARKVRPVFEVYRQVFHKVVKQLTISEKMKAANWAAKFLNLNDSAKLLIAKQILAPFDFQLPDYVGSHGTLRCASDLLKESKSQMSIREFNRMAMDKGLLCELERKSTFQNKKYKSITKKGLEYGENVVCPKNPKSTQPLWYVEKFDELLNVIKGL